MPEPVVVVAEVEGQPVRVLIYSGSLGDLLSTTLADAKEDAGSYPAAFEIVGWGDVSM